MKNKKRIITLKASIICTACLLLASFAALFCTIFTDNSSSFKYRVDQYVSDQNAIQNATVSDDTTNVSISGFTISGSTVTAPAGVTNVSEKTITIKDADELYLFSRLCNTDANYLAYTYRLIANIDYSAKSDQFELIGWKKNQYFTGLFEGAGYEISNLKLRTVASDTVSAEYNTGGLSWYAMFSKVGATGTVRNLGLVDTNIAINTSKLEPHDGNTFVVSPLIGLNKGKVQNVYVKDLRNPIDDEAGITAAGGLFISGLMGRNEGVFTNSYTAYSIVSNYTITDYMDFTEIVYENANTADTDNICFYNESITSYSGNSGENCTLVYDKGLIDKKMTKVVYGTYCQTKASLCAKFKGAKLELGTATWKWYVLSDYASNVQSKLSIELPTLRGITLNLINDPTSENDGKYVANISTLQDFSYMFELMRTNAFFASNELVYTITNDINLASLPRETYKYDGAIAATITGVTNYTSTVTMYASKTNSYPTIYNGSALNYVTTEGVECYGLFPYLTGTVKNLNVVMNATLSTSSTQNIKALGLVSGYVDGGNIENVNTYGAISFSSSIGKAYVGGAVGLLAGEGTISNVTTSGTITNTASSSATNYSEQTFVEGNAFGGVVGCISNTLGNVYNCYSANNITAALGLAKDYAIGGIIGIGYTKRADNLQNNGTITVTGTNYSSLYVAGVLGRHLGQTQQVQLFNNYGDITVTGGTGTADLYVSGVTNADIVVTAAGNKTASQLKNKGKTVYYASQFINGADVKVTNNSTNLHFTNVLNIKSGNGFASTIAGIYSLGYRINLSNGKDTIGDQSISMNTFAKYAPVLNAIGSSSANKVTATTVYSLRNVKYSSSGINNSSLELIYSGVASGDYITLDDVRNEGNITFNITGAITVKSLIASGIITNVSPGCTLTDVYNGGNITLDANYQITSNIYFSGICYDNQNGFTDAELAKFNPTNEAFDNEKTGSLDNIINNGSITVTNSTGYGSITYKSEEIKSSNGGQTIGTKYTEINNEPTGFIDGNINITGITYLNESVITNTFNLGEMFAVNYYANTETDKEINASGISVLNISKFAYIINSANNGTITAANLAGTYGSLPLSRVSAAGISVKNTKTKTNGTYNGNNGHSKQLIFSTINYGTIVAYNNRENITTSLAEPYSNASGILSLGLCNILNTTNYGNVYGNETVSGIFGVVYFDNFNDEVNSNANKVSLANSINYGNVMQLDKGANSFKSDVSRPKYSNIVDFSNSTFGNFAKQKVKLEYADNTYSGSIFGLVNFNGKTNAKYVDIRYLISFLDYVPFVGAEAKTPTVDGYDAKMMYSAYKVMVDGEYVYDKYMNSTMTYAPISTEYEMVGATKAYGVFNSEFAFRKAIEGNVAFDLSAHPTDAFLADYFQFVGYKFINGKLLDNIGWRTIAYATAANDFARDIEGVYKFLTKYKSVQATQYNKDITTALSTGTWVNNISSDNLEELVKYLFSSSVTLDNAKAVVEYVFSNECSESSYITRALRIQILEEILSTNSTAIIDSGLLTFNSDSGYSAILAEVLSENSTNVVKEQVISSINTYINNASPATLYSLTTDYLSYLKTANGNNYFSNTSSIARYEMAQGFFEGVTDEDSDVFYSALYYSLSDTAREVVDTVSDSVIDLYTGYKNLTTQEKYDFYKAIMQQNYSIIDNYLTVMGVEIDVYSVLNQNGYEISDFDTYLNNINITSTSSDNNVISARVNLWNELMTTATFKNYVSSKLPSGTLFYEKATEYNANFRSETKPLKYTTAEDSEKTGYSGDLGFRYAVKVTPTTNFYGDLDENGDKLSGATVYSPLTTEYSYDKTSVFTCSDKAFLDMLQTNGVIDSYLTLFYEYGSAGTNNQFTNASYFGSNYFNGKTDSGMSLGYKYGWNLSDFSGCQLSDEIGIDLVDDSGVTFNTKGGVLSAFVGKINGSNSLYGSNTSYINSKYAGKTIDGENVTSYTVDGNTYDYKTNSQIRGGGTQYNNHAGYFVIWDSNGVEHRLGAKTSTYPYGTETYLRWASLILKYGMTFYHTAYKDTSRATGVYRRKETQWFVNKDFDKRVYTTSYINYTKDDVLLLDGVLTEYDGKYQSEDERRIINKVFNDYLVSNSDFASVCKSAYMEKLATKKLYIKNGSTYEEAKNVVKYSSNNLYTYDSATYTYSQASGSFDKNKTYYTREKSTFPYKYTKATVFTTNGSLYEYDGSSYNQIKSGDFVSKTSNTEYIDSFFNTNITTDTKVDSQAPLTYLKYNNNAASNYISSKSSSNTNTKESISKAFATSKLVYTELLGVLTNSTSSLTDEEINGYLGYKELVNSVKNNSSNKNSNGTITMSNYYRDAVGQINAINSATNLEIVPNTINDIYDYGIKFDSLNLNVNVDTSSTVKTYLVIMASGSTDGITFNVRTSDYTLNTGSQHLTTTHIYEYVFDITNAKNYSTVMIVPATSQCVTIYDIKLVKYNVLTGNKTMTQTVNAETFVAYTTAEIISDINSGLSGTTKNTTITSATFVANIYNAASDSRYVNLSIDSFTGGQHVRSSNKINKQSSGNTQEYNLVSNNTYGRTFYGRYTNNTNGSNSTATTVNYVTYTVGYTYEQKDSETSLLPSTSSELQNAFNYRYRYDFYDRASMGDSPMYIGDSGIASKYVHAYYQKYLKNKTTSTNFSRNALISLMPLNGNSTDITKLQTALLADSNFMKLLASYSNSNTKTVINSLSSAKTIENVLIENLIKKNVNLITPVVYKLNSLNLLTDEFKQYLVAAYLATDYSKIYDESLISSTTVTSSVYYSRLNGLASTYRYINSDGTFNNDTFDAFTTYIGYQMSTTGYGIFALASNKGILNGAFIPDNVVLDNMKSSYKKNGTYYELTSSKNAYWRGGTDGDANAKTDTTSVNYHVLVEMKQLNKSISTTVFTLDLVDSEMTHKSAKSSIDLTEHTITYFVPIDYVKNYLKGQTLTIDNETLSIANLAKLTASTVVPDNVDAASSLSSVVIPSNAAAENGEYTISNAFRVFAEDRSVYADYDIIFKEIEVTFTLAYDTTKTTTAMAESVSATTATVSLTKNTVIFNVTSDNLPEKLDLSNYITVRKYNGSNYSSEKDDLSKYTTVENAFTLSTDSLDHVVDKNHDAYVTMEFTRQVTQGNYLIVVDVFGTRHTLYLVKQASAENNITEFVYEGNDKKTEIMTGTYNSTIPYGRLFTKEELTDYNSNNFYLNSFAISEGATVSITAAYAKNSSGLYVYTVSYNVTSEDGKTATYQHILTENAPFADNTTFATVYKNGSSLGDKKFSNGEANTINVAFTRDEGEPKYRVKYLLTNFYTIGSNVVYSLTAETEANGCYAEITYAGVTGAVYSGQNPASYNFQYVYTNTAMWDAETQYTSTYSFPMLVITKTASVDSKLNKLSFLDTYKIIGGLSTIMNPGRSLRPGGDNEEIYTKFTLEGNEDNYFDYSDIRSKSDGSHYNTGVSVETKSINYGTHTTESDYFIVGAVSNAELENYAPTFGIDDYAEIYQYTTISKLTEYGAISGGQKKTDYAILSTHTSKFIYVPCTKDDGATIQRFLVEINDSTGAWGKVYLDSYTGTGDNIGVMSGRKGSFTYNGETYTTDITAGVPTYIQDSNDVKKYNSSLYMDYIGTPAQNHFWYVSYVVFSEDYILNSASSAASNNNATYYHIALIDLTNNVLFNIKVFAPVGIANTSFYLNLAFNSYQKEKQEDGTYQEKKVKNQISAFAVYKESTATNKVYELDNKLQILPGGYFYFYIDLPDGYVAKAKFSKKNTIGESLDTSIIAKDAENPGSYLPPSSIVTQKIDIEIYIEAGTDADSSSWGISESDTFTKQITLLSDIIEKKE